MTCMYWCDCDRGIAWACGRRGDFGSRRNHISDSNPVVGAKPPAQTEPSRTNDLKPSITTFTPPHHRQPHPHYRQSELKSSLSLTMAG